MAIISSDRPSGPGNCRVEQEAESGRKVSALSKQLSYSTIRVCLGLRVVEGNCIAILALPICPMVSSTNAYQMESTAEDFDRIIYVQMELYSVLCEDITNFNEKPLHSFMVAPNITYTSCVYKEFQCLTTVFFPNLITFFQTILKKSTVLLAPIPFFTVTYVSAYANLFMQWFSHFISCIYISFFTALCHNPMPYNMSMFHDLWHAKLLYFLTFSIVIHFNFDVMFNVTHRTNPFSEYFAKLLSESDSEFCSAMFSHPGIKISISWAGWAIWAPIDVKAGTDPGPRAPQGGPQQGRALRPFPSCSSMTSSCLGGLWEPLSEAPPGPRSCRISSHSSF